MNIEFDPNDKHAVARAIAEVLAAAWTYHPTIAINGNTIHGHIHVIEVDGEVVDRV